MTNIVNIHEHLFQLYPSMPRYAADPSQSDIIRIYDHIMLRFSGHYGCQPSYFVKSPLCPVIFGDLHKYIDLPCVSFCSSQSIIIAINKTNSKKIRLNHYETTLYGQLQLQTNIQDWKFKKQIFQESQNPNLSQDRLDRLKNQHHNLVMKVFRAFAQINNLKELSGIDILIYKDFIEQEYLYSKEAFMYGLYAAVHTALMKKIPLQQKILHKAYQKIFDVSTSHALSLPQLINSQFNSLIYISQTQKPKNIQFPKDYSLLIANSMTPLPQKLIKGKRFNLRQCQIQIGIELIMNQLGIVKQIRSIKQLMQNMQCDFKQMIQTIDSIIPKNSLSTQKIQSILQRPLIQILKHIPYANNVIDQNVQFFPYKRILYFLQEQLLIQQLFQPNTNLVQIFQKSSSNAKQMIHINSQQIQQIKKVSQEFSAKVKILGNGWGGCVAILCKEEIVEKLEKQLIQKFYLAQQNKILLADDIDLYINNVGKPQKGLSILDPVNEIWYG